jgi:quinol monooxygenase YgiN
MTHALIVDFEIKAAKAESFADAIAENARRSLDGEPGCSRFDVCRDPTDAGTFLLYELYDGPAAIEAHLASQHYREFDALTRDWVVRKTVRTHVLMTS